MLRWTTPHELVTEPNPIFDFELRRIRRYKSPESLRRFSVITLVALNVFIALLFFAVFTYFQNQYYASIVSGSSTYPIYYGGYGLFQWIRPFSTALSGLSFAVSMGATLYYIAITAGSINRQVEAGHWDLLRLTNLPHDEIITANYAAAQIRAWRVMAIDRTIAVATAILPLLQTVAMLAMYGTFGRRGGPGPDPFLVNLLTIGLNLVIAFIIPAWRMRAFTAIGLAASARIRGTTFAFLAALAVGFVVEALTLLFSSSTRGLLFQVGFRYRGFFTFNFAYPIMVFLGTVVVFSVMQLAAISFARRAAFRQE